MNNNFGIYMYMYENNQFERQRTGLKDNFNVYLREKCFGLNL
jgi:hypothetical protein